VFDHRPVLSVNGLEFRCFGLPARGEQHRILLVEGECSAPPRLGDGTFVRVSETSLDVPLYWQCWTLDSPVVMTVTEAVHSAAADLRR
jgi:hypothetical protein